MEWIVPLVLMAGAASPLLHRALPRQATLLLASIPLLIVVRAVFWQSEIAAGAVDASRHPWIPSLGIDWSFRVDGLGNLFVLLIAGIGAVIVVHAGTYFASHPRRATFQGRLLIFMGAMLGVATADDLILLFVFWELTTISSFLLIGFDQHRAAARDAARQSLLVTVAGGLLLLAGLVLLADAAGTTSLSEVIGRGDRIRAHPHYAVILALVALGAFSKSALVPFHFWLPGAMQAPTPVSAYLHSSTMVKAGVFLLARLSPALGGTELWLTTLGAAGAITMLTGAVLALGQEDLKRLLAYSTISVLGLLTMLLGLGTPVAARAFAVTLLAHALYKGTLFLVAGNLEHATGSRSLAALGGLRRAMPWTAAAAIAAGASMAGGPPLFGFLAKETAYEAALEAPKAAFLFGPVTVLAAVLLVFAALRAGFQPFVSRSSDAWPRGAGRDPSLGMRVGPLVLAGLGIAAGLLVGPAERFLIAPAAAAIHHQAVPTGLALWHGFTPILALSVATLAAGLALHRARDLVLRVAERSRALQRVGPASLWDAGWSGLLRVASWQTRTLQNGSLRRYLAVTIATAFSALCAGIVLRGDIAWQGAAMPPPGMSSGISIAATLLAIGGSLLMLRARAPLHAVAALGAVGFGMALLFLVYSAPDLALTQLVVEVLTVVLIVFVLRRLPVPPRDPSPQHRASTIGIASLAGIAMAALTLIAAEPSHLEAVSTYFAEHSVSLAHGRNVVNVILVDFRALDTLGEITVLGVAALGALALLRGRGRAAAEAPR